MSRIDSACTNLRANRIVSDVGHFKNINVRFDELDTRVSGLEARVIPTPELITSTPTLELLTTRSLQAFAIATQVAGEKYYANFEQKTEYDTEIWSIDGILYYPWLFSKTLKHDQATGLARKEDVDALLVGDPHAAMDPGRVRKLEGIQTADAFIIKGKDPQALQMKGFIPAHSLSGIAEMVEVYEQSLLRDLSLWEIQQGSHPDVKRALDVMNAYNDAGAYKGPVNSESGQVTGQELFRGIGQDETRGPYTSQFLVLPYSYNGVNIDQKYPMEDDVVATVDPINFINIQRGRVAGSPNYSGTKKYAFSGRVLGSYVHNDAMFQAYFSAALICYQAGFEFQHTGNEVTTAWTSGGAPDGLGSLADVTLGALRVAWNQKFNKFMKLRPEAMAWRIDHILKDQFPAGDIKDHLAVASATLSAVLAKNGNGTYLLSSMYPEGSPTHPSFPAGHAVVAGAAITVIKAFIKTHDAKYSPLLWPTDAKYSINGDTLLNYTGGDLTIVGELNKLASNIAIGRDWASVHYRADGDLGIELGEQFAIYYLQIKLKEYASALVPYFELEKMNGELIRITLTNITVVSKR
uniref:Phosphatidic acid phosphatase type 2/haloperoxidase domain-containing protein n=1 Tax=viral metagenome TaxID=1070528 RepID=A0A6C0BNN9_9ZZZZ